MACWTAQSALNRSSLHNRLATHQRELANPQPTRQLRPIQTQTRPARSQPSPSLPKPSLKCRRSKATPTPACRWPPHQGDASEQQPLERRAAREAPRRRRRQPAAVSPPESPGEGDMGRHCRVLGPVWSDPDFHAWQNLMPKDSLKNLKFHAWPRMGCLVVDFACWIKLSVATL